MQQPAFIFSHLRLVSAAEESTLEELYTNNGKHEL